MRRVSRAPRPQGCMTGDCLRRPACPSPGSLSRHAGGGGGEDGLDAVFAGVAGAADGELEDEEILDAEGIAFERGNFLGEFADLGHDLGALQGDHGGGLGLVVDGDAQVRDAGLEVVEDLFAVGRVDDEQPMVGEAVDDDVVHDAAAVVADQAVAAGELVHVADVACGDAFDESAGVPAGDFDAAHVGDVEQAAGGADLFVFLVDGLVEDGHFPAGEIDELGVVFDVEFMEGGLEHLGFLGEE